MRPGDLLTILNSIVIAGGKAKPLKAAKKEKKELDEEDLAFKEKQRAGGSNISTVYGQTNTNKCRLKQRPRPRRNSWTRPKAKVP